MKHLLAAHHRAMAATYKSHADNLDDGHELKSFFAKLASHHHDLAEALGSDIPRGAGGDLDGPKIRRAMGDEVVPDHVHLIAPSDAPAHIRLVPRGGQPMEKADLPVELEAMFEV